MSKPFGSDPTPKPKRTPRANPNAETVKKGRAAFGGKSVEDIAPRGKKLTGKHTGALEEARLRREALGVPAALIGANSDGASKAGRPRITLAILPKDWEAIMLVMAEEGCGPTEIMARFDLSRDNWESLLRHEPEFSLAERRAKAKCNAWWEAQGRRMTVGGDGNGAVWKFNMANRYAWRDTIQNVSNDAPARPLAAFYGEEVPESDAQPET